MCVTELQLFDDCGELQCIFDPVLSPDFVLWRYNHPKMKEIYKKTSMWEVYVGHVVF